MSIQPQAVKLFPYEQAMLAEINSEGFSSLVDMFLRACNDYPGRVAYTALGQDISFSEIERMSRDVAAWLLGGAGLNPGDRVAIQLPNIGQYPVVAWGALRAGLVIVNTNPLYTARELEHQFNDSGAVALVALSELLPQIQEVIPRTGVRRVISSSVFDLLEAQPLPESTLPDLTSLPQALAAGADMNLPGLDIGMNDIALLQYTGGTTGPAKGAVLTHGNVFAGTQQVAEGVDIDPDQPDIVLAPMPLYHIYGFTMNVVSTFCADEWERRTGSQIFEGYGLSETSAVLTGNNPKDRQLGTVGRPMGYQEVRIVDEQGNTLGAGEEGELLVRGPQVMHGYWNRPDATAEALDEEGWFRTGDIAKIQQDGFVKICDRLKDMILVSGFNVYPNEIEAVVSSHPDVVECAAVGVPDEKSGEAVKLFVASGNSELDADALRSFCREQLTAYKVPKFVEFMPELPKSNVGKILRRELRE